MRFLIRVLPKASDRGAFLSTVRRLAKDLGVRVTHPRWTSYGALEVDVFAPSTLDFELLAAALEPLARTESARNLEEPPRFRPKKETVEEAIGYFNSERYWECHEALEGVWRSSQGEEKRLLQGLILVCAAQVHEQRGERDVALGIYSRALPKLSWDEGSYHGIDVRRLRVQVEASLEEGVVSPLSV